MAATKRQILMGIVGIFVVGIVVLGVLKGKEIKEAFEDKIAGVKKAAKQPEYVKKIQQAPKH